MILQYQIFPRVIFIQQNNQIKIYRKKRFLNCFFNRLTRSFHRIETGIKVMFC